MEPKYPQIVVKLTERDGNAFDILRRARQEMRRASIPDAEILAFVQEATSGDYDHLLQTVMATVTVT